MSVSRSQPLVRVSSTSSHTEPPGTLVELLSARSSEFDDAVAYRFLSENGDQAVLSFAELDERARGWASVIRRHANPGDRVLLVFPGGLDFLTAFFGCQYAGVLAVPATYPKPRRPATRLSAIAEDCNATLVLTTSQTVRTLDYSKFSPLLQQVSWVTTNEAQAASYDFEPFSASPNDVAFLQYTSGSTSAPKGVMISHGNVMHNLAMIQRSFGLKICLPGDPCAEVGVFWLPPYHDMGLIGGILESLYVGGSGILMSPTSFLRRPELWLESISQYGATISGAPNFGFDLCVRKISEENCKHLDLSSWRLAFCGAEPIRPSTVRQFTKKFRSFGFREDAFYPCYGLAEATLLAAGGDGPQLPRILSVYRDELMQDGIAVPSNGRKADIQELVSCGKPPVGQDLVIVDPVNFELREDGHVGEICVRGPNISAGYWGRKLESQEAFFSRPAHSSSDRYLRTGDLGFVHDGDLFVTGRSKELLIIRGKNHYPQDIEHTVEQTCEAMVPGAGAAFCLDMSDSDASPLVIVQEVSRTFRNRDWDTAIRDIRRAVTEEHEIDLHAIMLIRQASIPRTTSGKIQRHLCRQQYLDGEFKVVAHWSNTPTLEPIKNCDSTENVICPWEKIKATLPSDRPLRASDVGRFSEQLEAGLLEWLRLRAGVPKEELDVHRPFAEYGIDSISAVELSYQLEKSLNVEVSTVVAWQHPTPSALAEYLAAQVTRTRMTTGDPSCEKSTAQDEEDFERLLAEIENMTEDQTSAALIDDNYSCLQE